MVRVPEAFTWFAVGMEEHPSLLIIKRLGK